MSTTPHVIRKLLRSERDKVRDHLLRLDPEDRRLRFFGRVSDLYIETYSGKLFATGDVMLGCFIDGELRAVGELRHQGDLWRPVAEVAIKYRTPAKLGDDLVILSTVEQVRAASVDIHQRVMRGADLVTDARVTAAFITLAGRATRQPRDWVERFEQIRKQPA